MSGSGWRSKIKLVLACCPGLCIAVCAQAATTSVELTGRVVDENNAPLAGVRVSIRQAGMKVGATGFHDAVSDRIGGFSMQFEAPGEYTVNAEQEGYFQLQNFPLTLLVGENEVTLVLNPVREVLTSVDVTYSPPAIDFEQTSPESRLTGTDILTVPHPTSHNLRNALRALPEVLQDSRGGLHVQGAGEEQVLYTLDGFHLNDPLTGRFESRLNVDSVESVELATGNLPAEFGKGAAGVMTLRTRSGDDRWRSTATNFIPNIQGQKGLVLKQWSPRLNFSGPIVKSRSWFSNGTDMQYITHIVSELPKGQDRTPSWRVSNVFRNQTNLTPSNILHTGFLVNLWNAPRAGLTVLNPAETTSDRRARQWLFYIKDQTYFGSGALLEVGYAANRTFDREIPQGHRFLAFTPSGLKGNAFVDATRKAGRDQWLASLQLPSFSWLGGHQVRIGLDLDRESYWQDVRRTGYEQIRVDLSRSHQVVFQGNGKLRQTNLEASFFVEDTWKVSQELVFQLGVRHDWDKMIGDASITPRIGLAWGPAALGRTKISGGMAVIRQDPALNWFIRPLDQYALATYFDREGNVTYGLATSAFRVSRESLSSPLSQSLSVQVEHQLPGDIYASLSAVRRRGRNGLTYRSLAVPPALLPEITQLPSSARIDTVYQLFNERRDAYDGVTLTFKQVFRKHFQWLASYTRSRAFSNTVLDFGPEQTLKVLDNVGRMPWDAPNRLLSWGSIPLPRKNWSLAYLVEYHTGFPFTIQNEEGEVLGGINSFRFPAFFELNLHVERLFTWRNRHWALRAGFNNLTNQQNPNVVNNIAGSPDFLSFYGGQPRLFNFRLRWLGKE